MNQFFTYKRKNGLSILFFVMLGFYANGQTYVNAPVFNWNFEAGNVLLDEGTAQQNLTDHDSVTTGGSEPTYPGYGSVGAVFNGSTQCLSLSNADYGDRALNGTDRDGTIYICFSPTQLNDGSSPAYIWSKYKSGERQLALFLQDNNRLEMAWGFNDGNSLDVGMGRPMNFMITEENQQVILALSLDAATKEYTIMARDLSTGNYYSSTEANHALVGEYNTGTSDMVIGGRSDYDSERYFNSIIYWVRIYDEAQTMEQMKAVIEGNATVITALSENKVFGAELRNYPNPFKGETTISYNVSKSAFISIDIYNISGQKITTLVNENKEVGPYTVKWNGQNSLGKALPSGMYYFTLKAGGDKIQSRKMLLMY